MDDQKYRVLNRIDALRDHLIQVLGELVRIPSISPNYPGVDREKVLGGETRCNRALSRYYRKIGCEVDLWEEEPGRANLVGVLKGTGGGRSLIFNGHIDTVPPGENADWKWENPYSGEVEADKLYGLGSCDMKGGITAQYLAAKALVDCGHRLKGDLLLESVVGEETMDHEAGTSATINRGYRADGAIVSEPTSGSVRLAVTAASAGLLFMKVNCRGVAGHPGARFQFVRAGGVGSAAGVNAVEKGALILKALQDLEYQWGFSKKHPLFPPGFFTLHPGVIIGGPPGPLVPYIVSTYCRIEYIIWYPPQEPVEGVKQEITDYIMKASALDPWLAANPPEIEWVNHWPPFELGSDHPLVRTCISCREKLAEERDALRQVDGFRAVCDATFFNQAGIPAIACGPGDAVIAHTRDEWVSLDELILAAKIYAVTAMDWCGTA
jgi:acetylornithine deacetylase